jgi:hypothetical protein
MKTLSHIHILYEHDLALSEMEENSISIKHKSVIPVVKGYIIHDGCHIWRRNCLSFRSTWVHLLFVVGFEFLDLYCSV